MTVLKQLTRQKTFLTLLACSAVGFTTMAHAGFEWIPQKKEVMPTQAPVPAVPTADEPAEVFIPIQAAPVPNDVVLPLPDEALLQPVPPAPVMPAPAPVASAPAINAAAPIVPYPGAAVPVPITAAPPAPVPVASATPVMPAPAPRPYPVDPYPVKVAPTAPTPVLAAPTPSPMAPPPAAIVSAPPVAVASPPPGRVVIAPGEVPNSGAIVINEPQPIVNDLPPLGAPVPMAPLPVAAAPAPAPIPAELLVKPPIDRNNMHIIMPDDAPQSVVEQTQNGGLVISATPSGTQLVPNTYEVAPAPRVKDYPVPKSIKDVEKSNLALNASPVIPASPVNPVFTEAVGFARDVPLALALRQIVPPEFAFSFGTDVNLGSRVSWDGGRPWNEVVISMVGPLGYFVHINDRRVLVSTEAPAPAIVAPVPAPAVVAPAAPLPVAVPPPAAMLEPAAGEESPDVSADLPAELPLTTGSDENDAPKGFTSSLAEAPAFKTVKRNRHIKRVNITDPGSIVQDAPQSLVSADSVAAIEPASGAEEPKKPLELSPTPNKVSFWTAKRGSSLKETLMSWSGNAGADLVWDATYDFQLFSDFEVQGSFEKAVELLIKHGVSGDSNLDYSYVATSKNQAVQLIIEDKV